MANRDARLEIRISKTELEMLRRISSYYYRQGYAEQVASVSGLARHAIRQIIAEHADLMDNTPTEHLR